MMLLACQYSYAQILETSHKVDTLTLVQRTTLRTNVFNWLIGIPNIGVEFDINNKNWNRWSVGAEVKYRPAGKNTYAQPVVYNYFEARLEGRTYWRERQVQASGYLGRHKHWLDKIFSCRVKNPSHPKTVFYRGGYVSYSNYSLLFLANAAGRQGQAIQAGFTWGFVNQLYQFRDNTSLDFELGISAGPAVVKYNEFTYDEDNACYPAGKSVNWKPELYPVINDVHVSLVYRIGDYPLTKKYRWRYDVDLEFMARMDSLYQKRENDHLNKLFRDSVYEAAARDYKNLYDSLFDVHQKLYQESIDAMAPQRDTLSSSKNSADETAIMSKEALNSKKKQKKQQKNKKGNAARKENAEALETTTNEEGGEQ